MSGVLASLRTREHRALAVVAVAACTLAIAACGGASSKTLKVETGPSLIDDQAATTSLYFVQGVGDELLYAQRSCPPAHPGGLDQPRYRLANLATGRTTTYPCSTSVAGGAHGQLLVVAPGGHGELSVPGRPTQPIELPPQTLASAIAPNDTVFYVKNLRGGNVCIGRVDPGHPPGSCPPLAVGDDVAGQLVVTSTGAPVLIPEPRGPLTAITLTGGRYVTAQNEVLDLVQCDDAPLGPTTPYGLLSVAAAGDGSVWMTCQGGPEYPLRLSPDGRTLRALPEVAGYEAAVGAAADQHGNIWTAAYPRSDGHPDLLLRYPAAGGKPTRFAVDPSCSCVPEDLAISGNRLWIDDSGDFVDLPKA